MNIQFSPIRAEATLSLAARGDVLIINGLRFDLAQLQDGDSLPADALQSAPLVGAVERLNGEIGVTVLLPHGDDAPEDVRFPQPVSLIDGPCLAPAAWPLRARNRTA